MAANLKVMLTLIAVLVLVLAMVEDSHQRSYTTYRGPRMYDPYWCYGRNRPQPTYGCQQQYYTQRQPYYSGCNYGTSYCVPRHNYGSGYGSGGGGQYYLPQIQAMPQPQPPQYGYVQPGGQQQPGFEVYAQAQGQDDNQPAESNSVTAYDSELGRGRAQTQIEPRGAGQSQTQGAEASQQGQNTIPPWGAQPPQVGGQGSYYTVPIPPGGGGFSGTLPYNSGQDQAAGVYPQYGQYGDAGAGGQMQIQPYPYNYAQSYGQSQSQYGQPQYGQQSQYAQPQYAQPQYAQAQEQYAQPQYG